MGPKLAPTVVNDFWENNPHIGLWTNGQIGLRKTCPHGNELKELGLQGISAAGNFLILLKNLRRWKKITSWQEEVEAALRDFELVKDKPWKEQQWYAYRLFRHLYEIHEILHVLDIPPEDHIHKSCHGAYEPFLQLAFLKHIRWR